MKMPSTKHALLPVFSLLSCCLFLFLSACNQQSGAIVRPTHQSGTSTATISSTSTPPTLGNTNASQNGSTTQSAQTNQISQIMQNNQMPLTQTTCPANGTARPALMRSMPLGQDPTIVYVYNEIPPDTTIAYGHLKRYDVTTDRKTELVTSGISISNAQVSADGQWVLFLSIPDPRGDRQHSAMLQLIRMDGQGLQTLYCLPTDNYSSNFPTTIQWSTDQKSVLISTDTNNTTSTITLLTLATGTLQTELRIIDSTQLYHYGVLTWLDNSRVYITRVGRQGPPPPMVLYLLDVTKNTDTQGSSLIKILERPARFHVLSFDSSYDARTLFVADCLVGFDPFSSTITTEPATGGTQHTIYQQDRTTCVNTLRAVSPTALLLLVKYTPNASSTTYLNEAWRMAPDGSSKSVLFTQSAPAGQDVSYDLNRFTQYPWSNVARDGSMYTLQTDNTTTKQQTLLFGSLNGGNPTAFASTSTGSVDIVGWTSM